MYDTVKIVVGAAFTVVLGLSALSRRFPHIGWLEPFRHFPPRVSEAQRIRTQRRVGVLVGLKLILIGFVLPIGYVVLTVMMFNDLTRKAMAIVLAGSVVCIALGITAIVQSYRS